MSKRHVGVGWTTDYAGACHRAALARTRWAPIRPTSCGHRRWSGSCQQRKWPTLFDHLIGACKQRRRDGEAECLGRLQIDGQIELRRLHDRQLGRCLAFQDTSDIDACLAPGIASAAPGAEKTYGPT